MMLESGLNQRRKIKVSNDSFVPGLWCDYKEHHGYIRFVCDEYITLCVSTTPNPDPNARRQMNECCILIFNGDWSEVIPCVSSEHH